MSETTETTAAEVKPEQVIAPQIPDGFVSQDVFEREKKDRQKYKEEAAVLKKQIEENRLQELKRTQNWEQIAKEKEAEAQSAKDRLERVNSAWVNSHKFSALKTEALKLGIHDKALDDLESIDFPEINVETTSTGKILVTGADRAIANLKSVKPFWFKQNAASINPSAPETHQVNLNQVTIADLAKFEQEYKKNPSQANKDAYFQAIQKFKTK